MLNGRPLEGVRVVEVTLWGFVPSAAAILADWGATVLKVEHPEHGDPMRGPAETASVAIEHRDHSALLLQAAVKEPNSPSS